MLRDAAGFASNNFCIADRVQKRCFTVVNVAHDRDDRRTILQILVLVFRRVDHMLHVSIGNADNLVAKFFDDQFRCIGVDRLVLRRHDAVGHQRLHNVRNTFGHPVGQLDNGDRLGKLHVAHYLFTLDVPPIAF